ncbi:MAG: DUF302 domain-containing protein [Thiohalospira sp.]
MITARIIFSFMIISMVWSGVKAQDDCDKMFFSKTLSGDFEQITAKVISEFKNAGFGVVTEIDMDKTLNEKLEDVNVNPYKILGVCNPEYAYQAMQANSNIGVFLPCKVVIKQLNDNQIEVVAANPSVLMKMLDNKELDKIAKEIAYKMQKAIENI